MTRASSADTATAYAQRGRYSRGIRIGLGAGRPLPIVPGDLAVFGGAMRMLGDLLAHLSWPQTCFTHRVVVGLASWRAVTLIG